MSSNDVPALYELLTQEIIRRLSTHAINVNPQQKVYHSCVYNRSDIDIDGNYKWTAKSLTSDTLPANIMTGYNVFSLVALHIYIKDVRIINIDSSGCVNSVLIVYSPGGPLCNYRWIKVSDENVCFSDTPGYIGRLKNVVWFRSVQNE